MRITTAEWASPHPRCNALRRDNFRDPIARGRDRVTAVTPLVSGSTLQTMVTALVAAGEEVRPMDLDRVPVELVAVDADNRLLDRLGSACAVLTAEDRADELVALLLAWRGECDADALMLCA